jgi:PIN domain nuclease of toxin-antitoxin system
VKLLVDTHLLLWSLAGARRLPGRARELISDPANSVAVSVASIWEIAIKRARYGQSLMPVTAAEAHDQAVGSGYVLLDVTADHAAAVEHLPPLHGDPFDRLIVAQAMTEPMRLVTSDRNVARYSDAIILV